MRRYFVALCSVCIAAAVAALDLILALSSLDPQDRGIPGQHSPAERLLFFESCITFYVVPPHSKIGISLGTAG